MKRVSGVLFYILRFA